MSKFEDKITATQDFLANRASLGRLTTYQEVGRVVGELLCARGQRHTIDPVNRDKIAEVLKAIDDVTVDTQGYMLSAIVVHFADNEAGHRFFEQAYERGLYESDTDPGYRHGFHASHVTKAFAAFPEFVPIPEFVKAEEEDVDLADLEDADVL